MSGILTNTVSATGVQPKKKEKTKTFLNAHSKLVQRPKVNLEDTLGQKH
jgi:hypothetical protein